MLRFPRRRSTVLPSVLLFPDIVDSQYSEDDGLISVCRLGLVRKSLLFSQHRPTDPGEFVRQRHHENVLVVSRQNPAQPVPDTCILCGEPDGLWSAPSLKEPTA